MMSNACESALGDPRVQALLDAPGVVRAMLAFEAALARAQARAGWIPEAHAEAIAQCCEPQHWTPEASAALIRDSVVAGSLAIPVIQALKARVSGRQAQAVQSVHFGATSQDVIDTAIALQSRQALQFIEADLQTVIKALIRFVRDQGAHPILARTLMQPASVVSVSHKLMAWLLPLLRSRRQLQAHQESALVLQLGGPVGTLAARTMNGVSGAAVAASVAQQLGLPVGPGAWHTQRDAGARLAAECGVLVGSLGKIGRDLALLSQAEVGEVLEGAAPGRGGSSSMPHKHNAVGALVAVAAAQRAPQRVAAILSCMTQEQERSLGLWQAELAEWCTLLDITAGAAQALAQTVPHLVFHPERMRAHLQAVPGLAWDEGQALAAAAHRLALEQLQTQLEGWSP